MNDGKLVQEPGPGVAAGADVSGQDGGLAACRLTILPASLLEEIEKYGLESLGRSAPNRWMLPVIASWGLLYVARLGADIVGSAQIIRCLQKGDLFMDAFYIRPDYRGAGHGKAFLSGLKKELAELGFQRLLATLEPENSAGVRLYAGCGFEIVDNLPDYYGKERHRFLIASSLAVI